MQLNMQNSSNGESHNTIVSERGVAGVCFIRSENLEFHHDGHSFRRPTTGANFPNELFCRLRFSRRYLGPIDWIAVSFEAVMIGFEYRTKP